MDLRQEMPAATFTDADALADSLRAAAYDYDALYAFQSKYVENTKNNNAAILANFVLTLLQKEGQRFLMEYTFSNKISALQPSAIREILKATADPAIIPLAAGNPAPDAFPVDEVRAITADILQKTPIDALQYGVSEGISPCGTQCGTGLPGEKRSVPTWTIC